MVVPHFLQYRTLLPSFSYRRRRACVVALFADQHHVGNADGHFLRESAALRIALAAADVLVNQVDSFDDQLAGL